MRARAYKTNRIIVVRLLNTRRLDELLVRKTKSVHARCLVESEKFAKGFYGRTTVITTTFTSERSFAGLI